MIRRFLAMCALFALSGCITTEQAIDAGKQIVGDRIAAARQPAPIFAAVVTNAYAIDEGRWITGRVQAVVTEDRYFAPFGPAPAAAPPPAPVPPPRPTPTPPPVSHPLNGPITGSIVQ